MLVGVLHDLRPEQFAVIKAKMLVFDEAIQPMYDALARWHVSPDVATNLRGLLTDEEIAEAVSLLTAAT